MDQYQPPQTVYSPNSRPQSSPPSQPLFQAPKQKNHDGLKSIITTILILLMAPVLALAITSYVFQSYEVDGPSMETTLFNKERLIIWKVGRTWSRITKNEYIPHRSSIVVFVKRGLYDFSSNKEKQLIKRVIGLPGDRVVIKDGKVTIYNDEFPNGIDPDAQYGYSATIDATTEGNLDITVEAGHIFVLGDNRDNSLDSRSFGTVPVEDVVGTLSARILPVGNMKKF